MVHKSLIDRAMGSSGGFRRTGVQTNRADGDPITDNRKDAHQACEIAPGYWRRSGKVTVGWGPQTLDVADESVKPGRFARC